LRAAAPGFDALLTGRTLEDLALRISAEVPRSQADVQARDGGSGDLTLLL